MFILFSQFVEIIQNSPFQLVEIDIVKWMLTDKLLYYLEDVIMLLF
jgi:hypothetical protein